ncbi:hypothetical protein JVU11DRAFT_6080 [Chiua virens]|nr:hypothetical protein JVU11DRAFT_6080 [Chiua virens]
MVPSTTLLPAFHTATAVRHHTHENMFFSPYGRAYEHIHSPDHYETKPIPQTGDKRASPVRHQPPQQRNGFPGTPSGFAAWQPAPGVFPSACTCGDSCRCPGCSQHNNAPISPSGAYAACTNPASCSFCLDCTILSLPPSSAPPNSEPTSDSQIREFEEWLRQISPVPVTGTEGIPSGFGPYELSMNPMAPFPPPNPTPNISSNLSSPQPQPQLNHTRPVQHPSSADARCQGRCNCPSGTCSGPARCCGCCQGCECDQQCSGRSGSGAGTRTAYTVSGERNTCCNSMQPPDQSSTNPVPRRTGSLRVPDYMLMTAVRDGLTASVVNRTSPGTSTATFYPDPPNYMSMGDAPSRSSSSSSLSSRMSGRSPINANATGVFHPHGASNVSVGPGSRSPQPRPMISTGASTGTGAFAHPQPTRPLGSMTGQYNGYPAFSPMQFPPQ